MKINSLKDYQDVRKQLLLLEPPEQKKILVCCGTGCRAGGSLEIVHRLEEELKAKNISASIEMVVKKPGCQGMCEKGPLVWFVPQGIFYCSVKPSDVIEIVEKTISKGEVIERLLYKDNASKEKIAHYEKIPFIFRQNRLVLRNMGVIDPTDIRDYIRVGGYETLLEVLDKKRDPDAIIDEIEKSGLRGRGGGGFLTGRKWKACKKAQGTRYVLCNGDEGDPGAFMDRSIMEGDPHSILEGMILGGYALCSQEGYIYVRHEYPLAVKHLMHAIQEAKEYGLLGENIAGSSFSFDIHINRGGGAFVCGESSALMRSLEGKVGEPRAKYVHATDRGLFDSPTVLNNVETWANVPLIIQKGSGWFSKIGTEKSTGTKVFSLVGKVKNTGLIEVAMGTTLREVIFGIGGGIIGDRPFKAVQTGGPSGGCLPASHLDCAVDFDTLTKAGSMMGSGGMIVMDDRTCMVDVAKYFTQFLIQESCGKCLPCREGLPQLYHLLQEIVEGRGKREYLKKIEELAQVLQDTSLCGLGSTSANPVMSTLRYFREEYLLHILDKSCPAGVCKALTSFTINEKCTGCGACMRICPVEAISGQKREKHEIVQAKCIQCGSCYSVCKFDAITIGKRS
ncbi:MAG: 4Fe-4S binding protein [Candidatus Brocadiae bacterium]|nr:4Fe-4S binding protein [Candidatus Brocadiia bacterium]